MMNTNVPVGPRCTADVGTTTTCRSVSISSRTLTNWPGQSWRFAFGNSALIRTVPVVGSTWLSITCTLPVSTGVRPSGPMASTGSGPSAMPRLSSGSACCGRLNSTEIGLISRDGDEPGGVGGPHDVALVDLPDAGAPGDRRGDVGVGEDRARVVDRGLVGAHLRFELRDQRALGVDLLLVDRIGGGQPHVAFEIEPGVGELRLVLRLGRHRLVVLRLVGGGIDLGEDVAARHVLAFGERDRDQLAFDLRLHQHGVERARGADAVEIDRHVGALRDRRAHRHRIGCCRPRSPSCLCRSPCPAAASASRTANRSRPRRRPRGRSGRWLSA